MNADRDRGRGRGRRRGAGDRGSRVLAPVLGLITALAGAGSGRAAQPGNAGEVAEPVTLAEVVAAAIVANPALEVVRMDPVIREALLFKERGLVDHRLQARFEKRQSTAPSGTFFDPSGQSFQDTEQLTLGLARRLETGGEVGLDFDMTRVLTNSRLRLFNPSFTGLLTMRVTQPIVRGRGRDVTLGPLRIASNDLAASRAALERETIETVVAAEKGYWELAFRYRDLEVKRLLLEQAGSLLESNRIRFEIGEIDRLGIVEARSAMSAREEDVLRAHDELLDQADRLVEQMGWMAPGGPAVRVLEPTDDLTLTELQAPDLEEAARLALEHRPERREALRNLASRRIDVVLARDNRRPRVDLVGRYGFNGLTRGFGKTLGQITDADFETYNVGIVVEVPLENREARGELQRRRAEVEQALRAVTELESRLVREAREAARQVRTDLARSLAARRAVETAQEKLDAEEERFRQGLLHSFELLRFQEELALTRSREARALADLRISSSELERATGRLLEARTIEIDGGERGTGPVGEAPAGATMGSTAGEPDGHPGPASGGEDRGLP